MYLFANLILGDIVGSNDEQSFFLVWRGLSLKTNEIMVQVFSFFSDGSKETTMNEMAIKWMG